MKRLLLLLLCFYTFSATAQCDGIRYREFIFPQVNETENIIYGKNAQHTGDSLDLLLDVYTPVGDAMENRALVIFAHGGFFFTGSKDGTDVDPACEALAMMGYVTASINYRLGFPIVSDLEGPMTQAVMRGVQDMKAAIRWFRKSVAEDGNPYNIDPEQIYIAGVSAGGYITLHTAYLDEEEEIPAFIDLNGVGLSGGLEGNSGNAGYSSHVNAIISVAGAIGDTTWIHTDDEPACLFHGDEDNTVPYGSAEQLIFGVVPVTFVHGSSSISEKMEEVALPHCFETYEGQDHVPQVNQEAYFDTTLSIITNFLSHHICGIELDCSYRAFALNVGETQVTEIKIYPNPANDVLNIALPGYTRCTVQVFDATGKMVVYQSHQLNGEPLNVAALPKGMYTLRVLTDREQFVQRIIIE